MARRFVEFVSMGGVVVHSALLVRFPLVLFLLSGFTLSHNPFSHTVVSASSSPTAPANLSVTENVGQDRQINFAGETADFMLINEVDAVAGSLDNNEFIELFDGGIGGTALDGLSIVLFSGHDDKSYAAFDLTGQQTDENGYFLLGNSDVPGADLIMADSLLQNGPDAVALYGVEAAQMPVGSAVTVENLLDALVYDTDDVDDPGLLPLLLPGEEQANENARFLDLFHSLQRCPDGSGGQRRSGTYWPDTPTPKKPNTCVIDEGPQVLAATPGDGAIDVPLDSDITITFSEDVVVSGDWFDLTCQRSSSHAVVSSGGGSLYTLQIMEPFSYGEACQATIFAAGVRDLDAADPPDHLAADFIWSFAVVPARHLVINELDADTPGIDTAEFIELYDGGEGNTTLNGLVLVFFNGANDLSYRAVDLSSHQTNSEGRFLLGGSHVPGVSLAIPDGALQNGPDAVALYSGSAADFPTGSPISTRGLLDALVYGPAGEPDAGLLTLLAAGEKQLDEDGRDNVQADSIQRCPDGAGEQRHSASFLPNLATPGEANRCSYDAAPQLVALSPAAGEENVALDTILHLTFSEAVDLEENWISMSCEKSGSVTFSVQHQKDQATLTPQNNLLANDKCTVTVLADRVHDSDSEDPPDMPAHDFSWSFSTVTIPVARHMLINEVDADTEGEDTAEFIELYDGGEGNTALDGLVLVLFNGSDSRSYRSLGLDGYHTNDSGYFLFGNKAVPGVDYPMANGTIQNGPDAVALYAATAADFPAGTAVTTEDLLDAIVYSTGIEEAAKLMRLLRKGEEIVDEDSRGFKDTHSNQRCPDGAGGQRITSGYIQNQPTPGTANNCTIDTPPAVIEVFPADGAQDVPVDVVVVVQFDEPVQLDDGWIALSCDQAGEIGLVNTGGPQQYTLEHAALQPSDSCSARVFADKVKDIDGSADTLHGDYFWMFTTGSEAPVIADFTSNSPVTIGESVHFFNNSQGMEPLSYQWDFGDGSPVVSEENPQHLYTAAGTYMVTLTVMDGAGKSRTFTAPVEIVPIRIFLPLCLSAA